jgi:N,N'-diacetylchitobiose phosphorylase
MRYGHFDTENCEYVITRPDVPASWINYLGVKDLCTVINQNAGGYSFYKSSERGRVTRFRPNAVPVDRPGHYVYLRDEADGDYWSASWQPVGKQLADAEHLDGAEYRTRHGLGYSIFESSYRGISARQKVFIPVDDDVELWQVTVANDGDTPRALDLFGYVEFSFHSVAIDNQNFQMSLYAAGSSYADGIVSYDFYYEPWTYHYFTATEQPVGFDALRDAFIGSYRDERNPLAVERGGCSSSAAKTGNHCGALRHRVLLAPGESQVITYLLGYGNHEAAAQLRAKYAAQGAVDAAFAELAQYWRAKREILTVKTPSAAMNELINTWTLFQAETCVVWSRFASFVEVGGRTGLGYRDTAQDAMAVAHTNPAKVKQRLTELLHGQMSAGYGLHLFDPLLFAGPRDDIPVGVKLPTVVPAKAEDLLHGVQDACSDDHLWVVGAVVNYVTETGDRDFLLAPIPFADGGEASVYEHLRRAVDFTANHTGIHGIAQGLRADWNDCLNLGGGESSLVTFLLIWAAGELAAAARHLGFDADASHFESLAERTRRVADSILWDGEWYVRGFTKEGAVIGSAANTEGKIFLEHMPWAVISGTGSRERGQQAMDSISKYLASEYGTHLNWPSFTQVDDSVGYVTRVYPGVKENGAIFCHPNAWPIIAETILGRGDRAMAYYDTMAPANFNDQAQVRGAEPYVYAQFIYGRDHEWYGKAQNPWLTGTAGWMYQAATRNILGIRPDFDSMVIDPCIPADWDGFEIRRVWRGATYSIVVHNLAGNGTGVGHGTIDGKKLERVWDQHRNRYFAQVPAPSGSGQNHAVEIWMGERE